MTTPMQLAGKWLDAAVWSHLRIGLAKKGEGEGPGAIPSLLFLMARQQYASKASMDRLIEAHEAGRAIQEANAGFANKILSAFEEFLQSHAFLVSVDLFWMTFECLNDHINLDEAGDALRDHAAAKERARVARNHMEHIYERIKEGRKGPTPMPVDVFRGGPGLFDGTCITFGDEQFDVREMHDAVVDVAGRVAPPLNEGLRIKLNLTKSDSGFFPE